VRRVGLVFRWLVVGLLVLLALIALVFAIYAIAATFGFRWSQLPQLTPTQIGNLGLVGGTVFLGAATLLLASYARAGVAESIREAEWARVNSRARLDIVFDQANPALWWQEKRWVRVKVTNKGPAPAENVEVTLEAIEPAGENPMSKPAINGKTGVNVLPSRLRAKGKHNDRVFRSETRINPASWELIDVLTYRLPSDDNGAEVRVAFQILEEDALVGALQLPADPGPYLVLTWERHYQLVIRASSSNSESITRTFAMFATRQSPVFRFGGP
jgi:hypothetical protein